MPAAFRAAWSTCGVHQDHPDSGQRGGGDLAQVLSSAQGVQQHPGPLGRLGGDLHGLGLRGRRGGCRGGRHRLVRTRRAQELLDVGLEVLGHGPEDGLQAVAHLDHAGSPQGLQAVGVGLMSTVPTRKRVMQVQGGDVPRPPRARTTWAGSPAGGSLRRGGGRRCSRPGSEVEAGSETEDAGQNTA